MANNVQRVGFSLMRAGCLLGLVALGLFVVVLLVIVLYPR